MKALLWMVVIGLAVWFAVRGRRAPGNAAARKAPKLAAPQPMVRCAHCGVHLPATDAVEAGGAAFCNEAHRALGARSA